MKKTYKITLDTDLKGLSIGVIKSYEVEGEVFTKPIQRRAFRQIDEQGNVDPNFEAEVDAWTGEENFIQSRVNF